MSEIYISSPEEIALGHNKKRHMKNENQDPKAKLKTLRLELKNAKDALNLTGEEDLFLPLIAKLESEIEEVQETPKRKLGKLRAKLKTLEKEFFDSKDSSLSESINKLKEQIGDLENTIGLRTKKFWCWSPIRNVRN